MGEAQCSLALGATALFRIGMPGTRPGMIERVSFRRSCGPDRPERSVRGRQPARRGSPVRRNAGSSPLPGGRGAGVRAGRFFSEALTFPLTSCCALFREGLPSPRPSPTREREGRCTSLRAFHSMGRALTLRPPPSIPPRKGEGRGCHILNDPLPSPSARRPIRRIGRMTAGVGSAASPPQCHSADPSDRTGRSAAEGRGAVPQKGSRPRALPDPAPPAPADSAATLLLQPRRS
jgi:hypothetical protein